MPIKEPYTCPRCGYKTKRKNDMDKHLNGLKKVCPGVKKLIVLTDEVKQTILDNRVYHEPEPPQQAINNININQTINNYINKMDVIDKINLFVDHQQTTLKDFNEYMSNKYGRELMRLDALNLKYDNKKMIEFIDTMTSSPNVDEMNVMYDKTPNKLKIYDNGEWESHLFESGVSELLAKAQESYFDHYEQYLIEKMSDEENPRQRQDMKERLLKYYEFICAFGLESFVANNDDYYENESSRLYNKIKEEYSGKPSKTREVRRQVQNVVKANCIASMLELNKKMMEVVRMDEAFKARVLSELQGQASNV